MKIAIDLSPMQGPHRMRGIGATLIHFINNLPNDASKHEFVFFVDGETIQGEESVEKLFGILDLNDILYTVVVGSVKKKGIKPGLYGKLGWPLRALSQLSKLTDYYFGDSRLKQMGRVDYFLQFDQQQPLPRGRVKKGLILYDVIPYILKTDYLWDYQTARRNDCSRKSALNHGLHRWLYIHQLRVNVKRANKLFAISEQTKKDFVKYAHAKKSKIDVVHLGVDEPNLKESASIKHHHYIETSWGYIKRPYKLGNTPYLLFVGGVDPRRKISDLVAAFNQLRAQGHKLKLVLVGDILQGPENIPVVKTRKAIESSSYREDIIFMGFVGEEAKRDLYKNALAFVYPSIYEGFGLPVIEALAQQTPVICYRNGAVEEVAGKYPLYAENWYDIYEHTTSLIKNDDSKLKSSIKNFDIQSHSWHSTSVKILEQLK